MNTDKIFINIQGWMISRLGLKSNELLVFALIYGFSVDGIHSFNGGRAYISKLLGIGSATACRVIESLVNKGIIVKQNNTINSVTVSNSYTINHEYINQLLNDAENTSDCENNDFIHDDEQSIKETEKSHENANRIVLSTNPTKSTKSTKSGKINQITAETLVSEYGVSEQVANDWVNMRKSKRAPISETVINGLIREAGKANLTLDNVLQICVERNWQGFQASWLLREVNDMKQQIERSQHQRSVAEQFAELRRKHGLTPNNGA